MSNLDINKKVGSEIRNRRKLLKMTQEQFAFTIGLTRATIINIEEGRCSTTIEHLLDICSLLKCTPNDILPNDYVFVGPNGNDFSIIKLNAKSKILQAKLAEVKSQQEEILNQNKLIQL